VTNRFGQAKFKWPAKFDPSRYNPDMSSKMQFISNLLVQIHNNREKVVIVSNYTQTLEVLAKMCQVNEWRYFQLDGSTKVANRQILVDKFNNPASPECTISNTCHTFKHQTLGFFFFYKKISNNFFCCWDVLD